MGIKEDYQQALSLAKQGNYQAARNLLIEYNTEKTNALLAKIEDAIRSEAAKPRKINWWTVIGWLFLIGITCAACSFISVYWLYVNT